MTKYFTILTGAILLLPLGVRANPPEASYIFPAGGQRGQTVAVRIGGLFLHEHCGFEMLGPGVTAPSLLNRTQTLWLEGPLLPLPESQRQEDYPKDMAGEIKIATDAPLGIRRWRLWTGQGVTPAKKFVVGDLPEIIEKELPGEPIPVPVTLPVTINGRIFPAEDVDVWTFAALKGQTITCAVDAARLGSPLDARLEILGPDGKGIAENDDANGADPLCRFTAPADGTYSVRIHDINMKGGQAYVYRLTITANPWVDQPFPLGGCRGTKALVTLRGQGVPNTPVAIEIHANAPAEHVRQAEFGGQRSNPFLLDVDDHPEVIEDEKAQAGGGQVIAIPVVANGRIARPGESDVWRFTAKKAEAVELKLSAQRLGSPLQAVVVVEDDKGKVLTRGEGDAALTFTAPADGTYAVRVSEKFRSRGGPSFAYRLRLSRPAGPDFRLRLAADVVSIERGKQGTMKVDVERIGAFNQPVTLALEGLPADVSASPLTIPAGQTTANIVIKASPESPIRAYPLAVKGTAKIGETAVTRAAGLAGDPGEPPVELCRVAVTLPTPFKIVADYEMGAARRGSQVKRKYRIERNGYNGPLLVSPTDKQARHLQGATGPTITVPAGVNEFEYPLTLPPWMDIGRTCRVCVMGSAEIADRDGTKHTVSYSSVGQNDQYIAVIEAGGLDIQLDTTSLRGEPGKTATVPVRVSRGKDVAGSVRVELLVPEHIRGVSAEPIVIPATGNDGTLNVQFVDPIGPFNMPLTVRASLQDPHGTLTAERKITIVARR